MKTLTPKEEEVMILYWKNGSMFVRDLLLYYKEPKPHFNTLSTIVRGLEDKDYLGHDAFGKSYRYYALISEADFHRRTLKNVILKYFNNSYLNVVSSLVKEENISVDELKQLISDVENNQMK